jgi:hypothetical protein
MKSVRIMQFALVPAALLVGSAFAETVLYNNDIPDGKIATLSRPDSPGITERETADDFLLASHSLVTGGSFTGLLPAGAKITNINVEIYGVQRTEITPRVVPTRVNSPTNNALLEEDFAGGLTYHTHTQNNNVSVPNSVVDNIKPGATSADTRTGGEGAKSGEEVRIEFTLNTPFDLAAGQYFFVPQVQLEDGNFLWLSAAKPPSAFGSTPFAGDLQSWIRNQEQKDGGIAPDWERVGTDVIGGAPPVTYNAAFRLVGTVVVPEPATIALLIGGLFAVGAWSQRKHI